jgi:hypothetical protein
VLLIVSSLTVAGLATLAGPSSSVAGGSATSLRARLPLMPLPKTSLGATAVLLPLDRDSGVLSNAKAAHDATPNAITADGLARLGRLTGYALDYNDAGGQALVARHGLLEVQTAVELYRSSAGAVRGLAFWRDDDIRASHLKIPGVNISVTPLKIPAVGTARFGYLATERIAGKPTIYGVDLYFTTGQIVANVSVSAADRASALRLVSTLTTRFATRIAGVIAGTILGPAVPLPGKAKAGPPPGGPALEPLALTPGDLGGGTVARQGYKLDTDLNPISDYQRTITGGALLSFEEQVELFHSKTEASFTTTVLGRAVASKAFVEQVTGAEFKREHISVSAITPVRLSVGDEAFAALATFRAANGVTFYGGFIFVRVGRTVESVYAIARLLTPTSVVSLARLVAARAESHLK